MIFDEMRIELKELLELVRKDEQYCAAVMSGTAGATAERHAEHQARAARIAEIKTRYGLH